MSYKQNWRTTYFCIISASVLIFCVNLLLFCIHTLVSAADILLWRNKQISAGMLTAATVIWLLFEWIGYHLLTFICHSLILTLAILFFWSNISHFVNKWVLPLPQNINLSFTCLGILFSGFCHALDMYLDDILYFEDLKLCSYIYFVSLWCLN